MQVLCVAVSHKPHEDLYYICLNLKDMISAVITESTSGTDLVSHGVVPPGITSSLRSERGKGSCGVTVVPVEGMRHSSGCALPRVPHPTLAFLRSSGVWHWPQEHLWPVDVHHSVLVLTGLAVATSIFRKRLSYICFLLLLLSDFSLVLFL